MAGNDVVVLDFTPKSVDGELLADSRDLAKFFEKRHDNVLQDIRRLLEAASGSLDFRSLINQGLSAWFRKVTGFNDSANRDTDYYLITEQGCQVLVGRWEGDKPLGQQIRVAIAFKRMRELLEDSSRQMLNASAMFQRVAETQIETTNQIRELTGAAFGIRSDVNDLQGTVAGLALEQSQMRIQFETNQAQMRAHFEELIGRIRDKRGKCWKDTILEGYAVVHTYYADCCPCGCGARILNRDGTPIEGLTARGFYICTMDHREGKSNCRPQHVWPHHGECNDAYSRGRQRDWKKIITYEENRQRYHDEQIALASSFETSPLAEAMKAKPAGQRESESAA